MEPHPSPPSPSKPAAQARDSGPFPARQNRQSAKAGETAAACLDRESAVFWQAAIPRHRRLYAPCQRCRWHWMKSVTIPTQAPGCSLESASTKEDIMRTALPKQNPPTRSHRPRAITVFAAAFVAGAAAAVGVNRTLDVRMAQSKPRVESEAIFVALRSLPQGSPVTVWDVALRDWPKAMMPATALRASDTFSGHVLKHPLREGQPLLSIQLAPSEQSVQPTAEPTVFPPPAAYTQSATPVVPVSEGDLWAPAAPVTAQAAAPVQPSAPLTVSQDAAPAAPQDTVLPQQTTTAEITTTPTPTPNTIDITNTPDTPEGTAAVEQNPAPAAEAMVADPVTAPAPATTTVPVTDQASDPVTPAAQPASEPVTAPEQTAATPTVTPSSDIGPPAEAATVGDIPEPFAALPSPPIAATPIAVAPPTPPTPAPLPRPTHSRYLVVPENIAVQADASFAARTPAPQQPTDPTNSPTPQTASRAGSYAVKPLPATTAADRGPQSRPQGNPPQGRTPQRQGRQAQPANPGTPANTVPQPRLGSTMFPNLSAGIDAIEGRIRGGQPSESQSPAAVQARPLTTR
jgi:hypothetical protein